MPSRIRIRTRVHAPDGAVIRVCRHKSLTDTSRPAYYDPSQGAAPQQLELLHPAMPMDGPVMDGDETGQPLVQCVRRLWL